MLATIYKANLLKIFKQLFQLIHTKHSLKKGWKLGISFFLLFLSLSQLSTAQFLPAPKKQWSKLYGGNANDFIYNMIEAWDGGYMVVGSTESNVGNIDSCTDKTSYVAKMDANGKFLWQKFYGYKEGGIGNIVKYPPGGYILCGASYEKGGDVSQATNGGLDYWVVRVNDTGKIIWEKSFGGSNNEGASRVVVDRANNIYLGGGSQSYDGDIKNPHINFPFVGEEIWIIKLDPNGNLIWERSYGGTSDDQFYDMKLTTDNGLIFCGKIQSIDGDVVGYHKPDSGVYWMTDAWVVKIDSSSNIVWQRPCGGSSFDAFWAMTTTKDNGFVFVGETGSINGDVVGHHPPSERNSDIWVVKLNNNGKLLWQRCIGGNSYEYSRMVGTDNEGNFILHAVTGSTVGEITQDSAFSPFLRSWVLKLDKDGKDIIWARTIGGTRRFNDFYSILVDKNNDWYGAGFTSSTDYDAAGNDSSSFATGWIMKFYPDDKPIKVLANNSTLSIYPNPAKDVAYISTKNIKEIRLIDALGRMYFNKKIDNTIFTGFYNIPLNYIANGVYFLQAIDIDGQVKTGKLVVQK